MLSLKEPSSSCCKAARAAALLKESSVSTVAVADLLSLGRGRLLPSASA